KSFQSGMRFPSGQPSWQKGMPQSMHLEACSASSASGTESSNSRQSSSLSWTGRLWCSLRSISRKPRTLPMDDRLLPGVGWNVPGGRNIGSRRRQGRNTNAVRGRRFLRFERPSILAREDLHELRRDGLPGIEQLEGLAAAGPLDMLLEVAADHIGVGGADRLELDHLFVAPGFEVRVLVEHGRVPSAPPPPPLPPPPAPNPAPPPPH